ncbi:hypothetical protein BC831DRAFT_68087 [Entophlyctis helioformis]|nr:hypothetical protein BC831DRAFT_68087 [Entophlyctis helioformis]
MCRRRLLLLLLLLPPKSTRWKTRSSICSLSTHWAQTTPKLSSKPLHASLQRLPPPRARQHRRLAAHCTWSSRCVPSRSPSASSRPFVFLKAHLVHHLLVPPSLITRTLGRARSRGSMSATLQMAKRRCTLLLVWAAPMSSTCFSASLPSTTPSELPAARRRKSLPRTSESLPLCPSIARSAATSC